MNLFDSMKSMFSSEYDSKEVAIQVKTKARLLKRSCESLLGICQGIMADSILNDEEILFLNTWLSDNQEIADVWPGQILHTRIKDVLADNIITEKERDYIKQTLSDLIGGSFQDTGATYGLSTKLPLDNLSSISIPGYSFCFTGEFLYGTRNACLKAVDKRGGIPLPRVVLDLNYLVIGTMINPAWANTSHGRKIEKAMEYKNKHNANIKIINEELWASSL